MVVLLWYLSKSVFFFVYDFFFQDTVMNFLTPFFVSEIAGFKNIYSSMYKKNSVSDPFHFDMDPDPQIRFVKFRIRIRILLQIRPKIGKISTFFL